MIPRFLIQHLIDVGEQVLFRFRVVILHCVPVHVDRLDFVKERRHLRRVRIEIRFDVRRFDAQRIQVRPRFGEIVLPNDDRVVLKQHLVPITDGVAALIIVDGSRIASHWSPVRPGST